MAEKIFDAQVNYGWGLTLNMTGKAPAISKRIFNTYADALAYANDVKDSAIDGLLLSVVADTDDNNGVYFVQKAATTTESANLAKLVSAAQSDTNLSALSAKVDTIEGSVDILNKFLSLTEWNALQPTGSVYTVAQAISNVDSKIGDELNPIKEQLQIWAGEGEADKEKSIREISSEEVAKIVADANADYDTLKEISDWILAHPESVAAINSAIQENTENIVKHGSTIAAHTESINENAEGIAANAKAIQDETAARGTAITDAINSIKGTLGDGDSATLEAINDELDLLGSIIASKKTTITNGSGISVAPTEDGYKIEVNSNELKINQGSGALNISVNGVVSSESLEISGTAISENTNRLVTEDAVRKYITDNVDSKINDAQDAADAAQQAADAAQDGVDAIVDGGYVKNVSYTTAEGSSYATKISFVKNNGSSDAIDVYQKRYIDEGGEQVLRELGTSIALVTENFVKETIDSLDLGNAAQKSVVSTIAKGGSSLPTEDAVASYVSGELEKYDTDCGVTDINYSGSGLVVSYDDKEAKTIGVIGSVIGSNTDEKIAYIKPDVDSENKIATSQALHDIAVSLKTDISSIGSIPTEEINNLFA